MNEWQAPDWHLQRDITDSINRAATYQSVSAALWSGSPRVRNTYAWVLVAVGLASVIGFLAFMAAVFLFFSTAGPG